MIGAALLGAALTVAAQAAPPDTSADASADDPLAVRARELADEVAALRGLPWRHPVPIEVVQADEAARRLRDEAAAETSPEELAADERALWAWRAVPEGFDLMGTWTALMEEQVGGYYDPAAGQLVLVRRPAAADDDGTYDDTVAAHELVHALQDQAHDLDAWSDRHDDHADAAVASRALVEGDASWAMVRWQLRDQLAALPMPPPDLVDGLLPAVELREVLALTRADQPRLAAAPPAITLPLVLPYAQGLVLAGRLVGVSDDWSPLDQAFSAPPRSSEQVLHPERYLGDTPDWPTEVAFSELDRRLPGWTVVDEDVLGEVGLYALLATWRPDVEPGPAADGWDGDRYLVLAPPGEVGPAADPPPDAVVARFVFDAPAEATEALTALDEGLDAVGVTDRLLRRRGADLVLVLHGGPNRQALVRAGWSAVTTPFPPGSMIEEGP